MPKTLSLRVSVGPYFPGERTKYVILADRSDRWESWYIYDRLEDAKEYEIPDQFVVYCTERGEVAFWDEDTQKFYTLDVSHDGHPMVKTKKKTVILKPVQG